MLELNYNILWTILNIIILYLFLKKFLFKPVTAMMEKRTATIEDSLTKAKQKEVAANRLYQEYEKKIAAAEQEADSIIAQARLRAETEYHRILGEARFEQEQLLKETRKSMELEHQKSLQQAQEEIAAIAILATSKIIGHNVDVNTNKQLFGDLIKEVGEG